MGSRVVFLVVLRLSQNGQGAFETNTSVPSPDLLPLICSITMGCYWILEV